MERYRLQEWLTFIGTELHKTYSQLFNKSSSEDAIKNAREMLNKRLGYVETQLAGKPYLVGETFTVADAYFFVVVGWSGMVGYDLGAFPNIQAYVARIATRPAVHAAMKAEGLLK
jgi:glutathione S-transferase